MSSQHTPGPWANTRRGAVTSSAPIPGHSGYTGHENVEHYGGYLICESIYRVEDESLISAAPDMLTVLKLIVEQVCHPANADHTLSAFMLGARIAEARDAIAKAEGAA